MSRNNRFNQIFWGLAILIVGLIFLAQNFGIVAASEFWRYLPALLIVLGLYQLFVNQWRAWFGPVILILIGSYLLLASLGFIGWATFGTLIWPTFLILIGLSIIFRYGERQNSATIEGNPKFSEFIAFSGQKKRITTSDFQNGEITTMFGGYELDMRDTAVNNPPAHLQTTTMFGGTEIFVPADWDVRMNVVALFGGSDDKRRSLPNEKSNPDLIITGTVLFGGLEIK